MYRISRYWNRLAYTIMHIGQKMVWDYTGMNHDLLGFEDILHEVTEAILCDRK